MSEPASVPITAEFEAADRHLHNAMSLQQILFISISGIIGSGWLFAVLAADGVAGPASVISWVLGGIFIIIIALTYAEISGMLPRTGAIVRYPHLSHGAYTGFIMGWAYLISAMAVPAIEAEAVVTYLAGRFPHWGLTTVTSGVTVLAFPTGILLGVALLVLFFAVNYFGVRLLGQVTLWVTWWKIIVPTLTFALLFAAFKGANFTAYGFAPLGVSPIFQSLATAGIIFAYTGFRQGLEYGGEVRNPQRDVPIATVLSVLVAMVIYIALQVAFTGALDFAKAGIHAGDWSKLASSHWASSPLYSALRASNIALLGAFATVLLIDAAISPAATGWVYLGTSTRAFYGMSVDGYFPRFFERVNQFRIPWIALLASGVLGLLFFFPLPSWYLLVGFITSSGVLTYIMGGVGLPVLRRTAPQVHRPFRLPGAQIFAPLCFLVATMIFYWAGFSTLVNVFAAVFIGLTLFVWFYAPRQGWISSQVGATLGIAFLIVWIIVNKVGGWVLLPAGAHAAHPAFLLYFVLVAGTVVLFTALLWVLSNDEGRQHLNASWWLLAYMFATFLLSYYGEYGPLTKPALAFPISDIVEIAIGLVAFYWGVASGFATREVREIVEASAGVQPAPGSGNLPPHPAGSPA